MKNTQVVTIKLAAHGLKIIQANGILPAGEYSSGEILQMIKAAQAKGWKLLSTTTRRLDDQSAEFLDIFFQEKALSVV